MKKQVTYNREAIEADNRAARAKGMTYGAYKAWQYHNQQHKPPPRTPARNEHHQLKRHYTDDEAFQLWKEGKSDGEIGKAFGVSRQVIQRWRTTMELPANNIPDVDHELFYLVETEIGTFAVSDDKESQNP